MKTRILDEVRAELRDAVRWYEERGTGLGHALRNEVLARLGFLARFPLSAPVWPEDPSFRGATLRRFPYRLFYFIEGDTIVVAAIAHDKQRPGYWRSRVE
jgi:plasmid stabilization system protein ParE